MGLGFVRFRPPSLDFLFRLLFFFQKVYGGLFRKYPYLRFMKNFRTYVLGLCGKKEGYTIEFKGAKGGFPESFWETYSSFGNTAGGIIVLGITEKNRRFKLDGLTEDQVFHYKNTFWSCAHNSKKVSFCLCKEEDVLVEEDSGAFYLVFKIPRAPFDIKPVYLNGNPFGGNTYRRNHEGDYHCSDNEVRLMMADSVVLTNSLDSRVIKRATVEKDLDPDTIRRYRQRFNQHRPNHPWVDLDDMAFLEKIKAIAEDPNTGETGVTAAGILMFGTEDSLTKAAPHYFVDFREKLSTNPSVRYTDRYYPDGTWVPNLYQFFNRVYNNLAQILPRPFKLNDENVRIDETPADESLREAICNTLIHCNWSMMEGVVIERYKDRLYFSNPGTMLVTVEDFFEGGHSICRNKYLQNMFIAIGRGEHLGSGADVIKKGWNENGWPNPEISEHFGAYSDRVELTLRLGNVTVPVTEHSSGSSVTSSVSNSETIIEMIRKDPKVTHKVMAKALGISERGAEKITKRLRESGIIRRNGGRFGGEWEVL